MCAELQAVWSDLIRHAAEIHNARLIRWTIHIGSVNAHHIARVIQHCFAVGAVPFAVDWILLHSANLEVHGEHVTARGDKIGDALEEQIKFLAVAVTGVVGQYLAVSDRKGACLVVDEIKLAHTLTIG